MTAAIVQARIGSSRLPGKIMLEAAGKPLLGHLLERLAACHTLDRVIVATSDNRRDDCVAGYAEHSGAFVFRGSETDVLDRYYHAALEYGVTTIVRICSDCPLMDPAMIDEMVRVHREAEGRYDLVTSRRPMTYPDACDVLSFAALEMAWREASDPFEREHVVPFFWLRNRRVHNVEYAGGLAQRYRWTLDYPEDYELLRELIEALYSDNRLFGAREIVAHLEAHPRLAQLNAKYIHP